MSGEKFQDFEQGRIFAWEGEIELSLKSVQQDRNWKIRCYDSVTSTMDLAKELLPKLSHDQNGLILAKNQSRGRGRQGRAWNEAEEGFYGTFTFQSKSFSEKFFCLPLVVGLVVSEALANLGCVTQLKWPNDLLTKSGFKLGGILIEFVKNKDNSAFLIGVGLNILGEPGIEKNAASIFTETGRRYSAPFLASLLTIELQKAFMKVQENGFLPFRERWLAKTKGINERLSVHVGTDIVTGIFRGVGELGYLHLEVDGVIKEISSGELITENLRC